MAALLCAPIAASADSTPQPMAQVMPTAPQAATAAPTSDAAQYAAREHKDVAVAKFHGGGEVVIMGGGTVLLVLLIVLILL